MFENAPPLPSPKSPAQAPAPAGASRGTVLVIDDELALVRAYARALGAEGFHVLTATDGATAELLFRSTGVDAVVSDISMPGLDGIDLLQILHRLDPDVPVILATGERGEERRQRAVNAGALMFLVKPVDLRALGQIVTHATFLHAQAVAKRSNRACIEQPAPASSSFEAALARRFESALAQLWMAFQPIVSWTTRSPVAFEALVRSDEPSLAGPKALLDAAARTGRTWEVGRAIRAQVAAAIPSAPRDARIFVNLNASELEDDQLYSPSDPLHPHARRVVLEITERDALDRVQGIERRLDRLRAAGYRLAVDDLGAGYSGLASFVTLQPSVVKLDRALIDGIDRKPANKQVVQSMVHLCKEMGVDLIGEGVETEAERQTLGGLGCALHQGFLYGRPRRGFGTCSG